MVTEVKGMEAVAWQQQWAVCLTDSSGQAHSGRNRTPTCNLSDSSPQAEGTTGGSSFNHTFSPVWSCDTHLFCVHMVCVAHLRGSHIKFVVLDILSMATMFACCQNFVLITNFCLYSVCRWPVLQPLGAEWLCQILALFHHHKRKTLYSLSTSLLFAWATISS